MSSTNSVASKVSLFLDLPPSCIQFCPAHPEYFIVGTYNLQKDVAQSEVRVEDEFPASRKPQSRNGSLVVFKTDGQTVNHVQTLSQPSALLDLRFHPNEKMQGILAVVSSTGTLAVFRLEPNADSASPLQHIATSRCDDVGEDVLFLQCNWHSSDTRVIGVTASTGGLAKLLKLDNDWRIKQSVDLDIGNSMEAWCIAFSPRAKEEKDSTTVYCGGDDSILRYNSYESTSDDDEFLSAETSYAPLAIKGRHNAGVTAILPLEPQNSDGGRLVVTGSYDDHVRLFSIHDPNESYGAKRVKLLSEEDLGGGVWRLDLVHIGSYEDVFKIRILASCMHAGTRIIEFVQSSGREWACNVLAQFEEHKSMNYGCAFIPKKQGEGKGLQVVSTSFYDKLLCLWEYEET